MPLWRDRALRISALATTTTTAITNAAITTATTRTLCVAARQPLLPRLQRAHALPQRRGVVSAAAAGQQRRQLGLVQGQQRHTIQGGTRGAGEDGAVLNGQSARQPGQDVPCGPCGGIGGQFTRLQRRRWWRRSSGQQWAARVGHIMSMA
jgi:hypothetical protein